MTEGSVTFDGQDVFELEPEERARAGLFLAFQYPIEIPGVTTTTFLRTALNAHRKARGEEELDPMRFPQAGAEEDQGNSASPTRC